MDLEKELPKKTIFMFLDFAENPLPPKDNIFKFLTFYCVNNAVPLTIHKIFVGSKIFKFLENCILQLIKRALLLTVETTSWCCNVFPI